MEENKIIYPQYRKYANNKSFFKIISKDKFEEIQQLGNKYKIYFFEAKILPDRNYIHDLTFNYKGNWEFFTPEEYENIKKNI
ncbi:hypothetical protein N9242_00250 [Vicingaceae bacterium]|nr:hypothetical protein [Vicingaceae bacterium]